MRDVTAFMEIFDQLDPETQSDVVGLLEVMTDDHARIDSTDKAAPRIIIYPGCKLSAEAISGAQRIIDMYNARSRPG